ncbi:hypothetical protein BT69DRAFT_1353760 [Atractiella rhizophila]|nr:hypothetical protein BT69DRAFT_1353760 [Atractiella rhizophila]
MLTAPSDWSANFGLHYGTEAVEWLRRGTDVVYGALGQNGYHFLWSCHSFKVFGPKNMVDLINESLGPYFGLVTVKTCALGVNDTYFVLLSSGQYFYDFKNNYPGLANAIATKGPGAVHDIQLHPTSPEYYFVCFTDNSVEWQLPSSWNNDFRAYLAENTALSNSAAANALSRNPESNEGGEFINGFVQNGGLHAALLVFAFIVELDQAILAPAFPKIVSDFAALDRIIIHAYSSDNLCLESLCLKET